MTLGLATTTQNIECDATVDTLNSAKVQIYDGTRPADANTEVTTQTKLAEFTLGNPAFGDSASGVATANGMPMSTTGLATGTATWGRIITAGSIKRMDGSAGMSGADFILNNTSIATDQTVQLLALSYSRPAGG